MLKKKIYIYINNININGLRIILFLKIDKSFVKKKKNRESINK